MATLFIDHGLLFGNGNQTKEPLLNADQTTQVGKVLSKFTENNHEVVILCPEHAVEGINKTALMGLFAGNTHLVLQGYKKQSLEALPQTPIAGGGGVFLTGNHIAHGVVVGGELGKHIATHHVTTGKDRAGLLPQLVKVTNQMMYPSCF